MNINSKKTFGNDWKKEIQTMFGGRGAKWVFVSLNEVEETLARLESQGIDCDNYRKWTTKLGKAWIRFTAARVHDGVNCAGFAILNEGSTINKPKQLHFIDIEKLEDIIEKMPGTPKSLKLEEDSAPKPKVVNIKTNVKKKAKEVFITKESVLEAMADEINSELEAEVVLNEPPQSDDPSDWEEFLAAEGLLNNFDDFDI